MARFFELRVYRCAAGRLPDVLARFERVTLKIWERLGIQQAGFFVTAVGQSNCDLTYLLAWDSVADRQAKWTAFQTDAEWIAARAQSEKNGQIVESIGNQLLQPVPFSVLQ
jgi:hypothetical protein